MSVTQNKNEKFFRYLDELRESGETNMFGAGPYLARDFGLPEKQCREILSEWMKTFSERHPEVGRRHL